MLETLVFSKYFFTLLSFKTLIEFLLSFKSYFRGLSEGVAQKIVNSSDIFTSRHSICCRHVSIFLSVCLSVTSCYCTKTAKHRIYHANSVVR